MIDFVYNTSLVSEKAFQAHKKLYAGYANKVNEILAKLSSNPDYDNANKNYSYYRGLKAELSYNLSSVLLHELFFRNLCRENEKPGECFDRLAKDCFGGLEEWQDDFIACGKSSRGWCIASYEQKTCSLQNILLDTHDCGLIINMYPLIVLDCYEHSFMMDYPANQDLYIENAVKHLCWKVVERRTKALEVE